MSEYRAQLMERFRRVDPAYGNNVHQQAHIDTLVRFQETTPCPMEHDHTLRCYTKQLPEPIPPEIGSRWHDIKFPTRILTVTSVEHLSPLDRNIVGTIDWPDDDQRPESCPSSYEYATDYKTFAIIWRPLAVSPP